MRSLFATTLRQVMVRSGEFRKALAVFKTVIIFLLGELLQV